MLEEVGETGPALDLVARADVVPEAHRGDRGQMVLGEHHAQAVGQAVLGRCQAAGACLSCGRVTHGHVRPFDRGTTSFLSVLPLYASARTAGEVPAPRTPRARLVRVADTPGEAHREPPRTRSGPSGTGPDGRPGAVPARPVQRAAGALRTGRGRRCQWGGPQWCASEPVHAPAETVKEPQQRWPAAARRPRRPTTRTRRRSSTSTSWTRCRAPSSNTRTRSSTREPCRTPATASSRFTVASSTR